MSVDCFLDTNVLVYAAAGRGAEEAKRKRALELIENEDFGLGPELRRQRRADLKKRRATNSISHWPLEFCRIWEKWESEER